MNIQINHFCKILVLQLFGFHFTLYIHIIKVLDLTKARRTTMVIKKTTTKNHCYKRKTIVFFFKFVSYKKRQAWAYLEERKQKMNISCCAYIISFILSNRIEHIYTRLPCYHISLVGGRRKIHASWLFNGLSLLLCSGQKLLSSQYIYLTSGYRTHFFLSSQRHNVVTHTYLFY